MLLRQVLLYVIRTCIAACILCWGLSLTVSQLEVDPMHEEANSNKDSITIGGPT